MGTTCPILPLPNRARDLRATHAHREVRSRVSAWAPSAIVSKISRTAARPGAPGARTSASGRGAPCARTTARTATPGTTSPTTTRARAPTAGTRTAWPASATTARRLCFALAFWNGRDPILKERIFGLTGPEGNHGEDAKEYWWYLDSTPTHSWMRWRYHYPQARVPVRATCVDENRARGRARPGVRAGRHRRLRRRPLLGRSPSTTPRRRRTTCCMRITRRATRARDGRRCTCCRRCGSATPGRGASTADACRRSRVEDGALVAEHRPARPRWCSPATARPTPLFCDNETNARAAVRRAERDAVPEGRHQRPRRARRRHGQPGADAAPRRRCATSSTWPPARRRRSSCGCERRAGATVGADFDRRSMRAARSAEADEFYADADPAGASADEALVLRQAFAGMLWRKQFYHYDVERWLDGDPAGPPPPRGAATAATHDWRTSTTTTSSRCPTRGSTRGTRRGTSRSTASRSPTSTRSSPRSSCSCCCREWYMHPNGQLPAYEWAFGDVNPPVHAWAALRVFEIDGGTRLRLPRARSSTSC